MYTSGELNRNENFAHSNSVHTQTAFTVRSQLFESSRFSLKPNSKQNSEFNQNSIMNRQLQQGMALPPFRRITRKTHSGVQTQLTFSPINYASFNEFLSKLPPPELTISDVKHQVIPSTECLTFRRVDNDRVDAICQTLETQDTECHTQTEEDRSTGQDTECQTTASIEEEDTPMFRKNLRKVMDVNFLAAATRREYIAAPKYG